MPDLGDRLEHRRRLVLKGGIADPILVGELDDHLWERFAADGVVHVRRRDGGTFSSNPINVAVESGFYDIDRPGEAPSKEIEEFLGGVESKATTALRTIDSSGRAPAAESPEYQAVLMLLALQLTRTPEQRERMLFADRIVSHLQGRPLSLELVAEYLAEVHLGFDPGANEVQAAFEFAEIALQEPGVLTQEFAIRTMLTGAGEMAPYLAEMCWTVEHVRQGRLLTSDTPLVLWREPSPRDRFEGFGVANAGEVRFPLDPLKQLVLTRKVRPDSARVGRDRARACNLDVAASCHRFVVSSPAASEMVASLPLNTHRPVLRFDTGPLYESQPDGTDLYQGEILHSWVPRR